MVVVSLRAFAGLKSDGRVGIFNSSKMLQGAGGPRRDWVPVATKIDRRGGLPDQAGSRTTLASMENLISRALDKARRMLGSSEPNSKVISRLQCWQFV
jgi:hypothetical protein